MRLVAVSITTPKIYILLPVHDRSPVTEKFIICLQKQSYSDYHLILIDDGSQDGTAEMVKSYFADNSNLTILTGTGNWWWAGSLQQGFEWLQTAQIPPNDLILMINDDTEMEANFLEVALNLMQEKKNVILGAQIYDLDTKELVTDGVYVDWRFFHFLPPPSPDMINCLATNGIFMEWQTWQSIGGFYPQLLPHYTSDYEFTIRAHTKGVQLITDSQLRLHWNTKTTNNHSVDKLFDQPFWKFLSAYFSRKNPHNPVTLTVFIAIACPWRWRFLNWGRVWKGFLIQCGRYWQSSRQKASPKFD